MYNTYVRIISGQLPCTPADAACTEAGILPFRHVISATICKKAAAFAEKTSGNERIFLLSEGCRILRTVANVDLPPVAKIHWYGDKSWQSGKPKIDSTIKDRFRAGDNSITLRASVIEWLRNNYPNHLHRYTDGSLSNRGVGIGIYGLDVSRSLSLAPLCSIFSAEAAAVFIAATTPAEQPILILTDSASVVSALQSESPAHPWLQGILRFAPPDTTFAWIPGHCGVPGNTAADRLAGAGYASTRYTNKVPLQDIKRWITKSVNAQWATEWSQQSTCHLRKIKQDTQPWTDVISLKEQRIISRLRTGYTRLSHNMEGLPFHRICTTCNTHNKVEHFLCVCPQYEFHRRNHGLTGSIRENLCNDTTTLNTVICFLKDSGLYS